MAKLFNIYNWNITSNYIQQYIVDTQTLSAEWSSEIVKETSNSLLIKYIVPLGSYGDYVFFNEYVFSSNGKTAKVRTAFDNAEELLDADQRALDYAINDYNTHYYIDDLNVSLSQTFGYISGSNSMLFYNNFIWSRTYVYCYRA